MSAGRKSATVVMPVRAAMMAGSPICRVEAVGRPRKGTGRPWWKMVWPCEPISAIFFVAMRKRRQAVSAASAKVAPKRKLSWLRLPAEMSCCSATRRISFRSWSGKVMEVWFRSLAFRRGAAPETRARATSMASAEVPDIRPRTRDDLGGMGRRKMISPQRAQRAQRRKPSRGEKDNAPFDAHLRRAGSRVRDAEFAEVRREEYSQEWLYYWLGDLLF